MCTAAWSLLVEAEGGSGQSPGHWHQLPMANGLAQTPTLYTQPAASWLKSRDTRVEGCLQDKAAPPSWLPFCTSVTRQHGLLSAACCTASAQLLLLRTPTPCQRSTNPRTPGRSKGAGFTGSTALLRPERGLAPGGVVVGRRAGCGAAAAQSPGGRQVALRAKAGDTPRAGNTPRAGVTPRGRGHPPRKGHPPGQGADPACSVPRPAPPSRALAGLSLPYTSHTALGHPQHQQHSKTPPAPVRLQNPLRSKTGAETVPMTPLHPEPWLCPPTQRFALWLHNQSEEDTATLPHSPQAR